MQSDSPESDPRLQKSNPGAKVTTGFVDPCIVYLEATLPGEIPVLYTFFALSSSELKDSGFESHLKLDRVAVLKWKPNKVRSSWMVKNNRLVGDFSLAQRNSILLASKGEKFFPTLPTGKPLEGTSRKPAAFQGSIRFIDEGTAEQFLKLWIPPKWDIFAVNILRYAPVEWPSIGDALASLKRTRLKSKPVPFQRKLGHLIYSMFKKKSKPVSA